jgi:polyribonucleotide nucleotidyltransferase
MDMMIAGTLDSIVMVEGEMLEASEADMLEAIKEAHKAIKVHCQVQMELASEVPSSKVKREYSHENHNDELRAKIKDMAYQKYYDITAQGLSDRYERNRQYSEVKDAIKAELSAEELVEEQVGAYIKGAMKSAIRQVVLDSSNRMDGRAMDEIRPIWSEVGYLPGVMALHCFREVKHSRLQRLP